jgi:DNA-directed RNA polymerase beta subunit
MELNALPISELGSLQLAQHIDAVKDRIYEVVDGSFNHTPLNKFAIDSYNEMVDNELENILSKPIYVESDAGMTTIAFSHIIRLPPFKGKLGKGDVREDVVTTPHQLFGKDRARQKKSDYDENGQELLSDYEKTERKKRYMEILRGQPNDVPPNPTLEEQLMAQYAPKPFWMTANDAKMDSTDWNLSIYADVIIIEYQNPNSADIKMQSFDATDDSEPKEAKEAKVRGFDDGGDDEDIDAVDFSEIDLEKKIRKMQIDSARVRVKEFVKLFEIPLMVGSKWDWMIIANAPSRTWAAYGICDTNPLAYFVIGNEKNFVTQEKTQPNIDRCFLTQKELISELRSETVERRSMITRLHMHKISIKGGSEVKICTINLRFLMKDDGAKTDFSFLNIFRIYLIWDMSRHEVPENFDTREAAVTEFTKYLDILVSPEAKRPIITMLIHTVRHMLASERSDQEFIANLSERIKLPQGTSFNNAVDLIKSFLDKEFFPHVEIDSDEMVSQDSAGRYANDPEFNPDDPNMTYGHSPGYNEFMMAVEGGEWIPFPKLFLLTKMAIKYTKCYFEHKKLDNRDHSGTKQLATIGIELGSLVEKMFRQVKNAIQKKLSENLVPDLEVFANQITIWGTRLVTTPLRQCFSTGNWGLKQQGGTSKLRPGVVQAHDISSVPMQYAGIRKVAIPTSKQSNISAPRQVDPSSYGILDPSNTPDSDQVGLVKQLACSVMISNDNRVAHQVAMNLAYDLNVQGKLTSERRPDTVLLNIDHIPIGYADRDALKKFRDAKRMGELGYLTEVYHRVETDQLETTEEFNVITSGGRAMRPMFVIENNKLLVLEKGFLNADKKQERLNFVELIAAGAVEFISANEFEFGEIVMTYQDFVNETLYTDNPRQLTHMELDPYFEFSFEISTLPFANMMPNPRVIYYGGMFKQAMGMPTATFQGRQDTDLKVLNYSQKPLVSTDMLQRSQLDQQASGINVTVFVLSRAFNDEDATIWNKSSFERGMFHATLYETYKKEANNFAADENDDPSRMRDGIIRVKMAKVEEAPEDDEVEEDEEEQEVGQFGTNTAKIGEVRKNVKGEKGKEEDQEWPIKFIPKIVGNTNVLVRPGDVLIRATRGRDATEGVDSVKVDGYRAGFIHSSHQVVSKSTKIQKVTVRFPHQPGIGDKMSTRQSQKGVIGAVVPYVDMPFAEDGLVPDVIFSPTSFGSRMTSALFAEMMVGGAAVMCNLNLRVNRLVRFSQGMTEPEILQDFYIPLEDVYVLKNKTGQGAEFLGNDQIRKDAIMDFLKALAEDRPDQSMQYFKVASLEAVYDSLTKASDAMIRDYIRTIQQVDDIDQLFTEITAEYLEDLIGPQGLYEKRQGLMFVMSTLTKNAIIGNREVTSVVGKRIKYLVPRLEFVATLRTGTKAILYSQLPAEFQIKWYNQNNNSEKLIPAYRVKDYETKTVLERYLDDSDPDHPVMREREVKAGVDQGLIQKARDGTTFRHDKEVSLIGKELLKAGFSPNGKRTVTNGKTGEVMEAEVFVGPCYYMALKHLVENKRQMRDEGSKDLETHAATKGKKHGGGPKHEEMSRITMRAHGSRQFLRERMLDAADAYRTLGCVKCGDFCYANPITIKYQCDTCGEATDVRDITVPYSFVRIQRIIAASGISVRMDIRTEESKDADFEDLEFEDSEGEDEEEGGGRKRRSMLKVRRHDVN